MYLLTDKKKKKKKIKLLHIKFHAQKIRKVFFLLLTIETESLISRKEQFH